MTDIKTGLDIALSVYTVAFFGALYGHKNITTNNTKFTLDMIILMGPHDPPSKMAASRLEWSIKRDLWGFSKPNQTFFPPIINYVMCKNKQHFPKLTSSDGCKIMKIGTHLALPAF